MNQFWFTSWTISKMCARCSRNIMRKSKPCAANFSEPSCITTSRVPKPQSFTQAYARFAHIDAPPPPNDDGRIRRLRKYLVRRGVSQTDATECEIATTNTWQPWGRPACKNPLAVLDCQTRDPTRDILLRLLLCRGWRWFDGGCTLCLLSARATGRDSGQ